MMLSTIKEQPWTGLDILSGQLAGNKIGKALSKVHYEEGTLKWIQMVCDSVRLYYQAGSLGLFKKNPNLDTAFKVAAATVAVLNLLTVQWECAKEIKDGYREDPITVLLGVIWNITPKIHAAGEVAMLALEFQKHPMRAAAAAVSGVITIADRIPILTPGHATVWSSITFSSRLADAITERWVGTAAFAIKTLKYL